MDARLQNSGEEGGQGQLHREEKEKKPVLKKVKDKVKKMKHTLTGKKNGHDDDRGQNDDRANYDDRADYDEGGSDEEEEGDAPLEREAAMDKDPEVHGAPMYESEKTPPVQELVAKYDPAKAQARSADASGVRSGNLGGQAAHEPATHGADTQGVRFADLGGGAADDRVQEAPRDDSSKVRLGDLDGSAVEDPAAPNSKTPAAREGEDIGESPVVRDFQSMSLSDDASHVGAAKQGTKAEQWKDAAAEKLGAGTGTGTGTSAPTYTEKIKNVATVPVEYGRNLVGTVYGKVAGGGTGTAADTGKQDDVQTREMPVSDAGATEEQWKDAPAEKLGAGTGTGAGAPTYTEKIKNVATVPVEYGRNLVGTVYGKVAGGGTGTAADTGKQDDVQTNTREMPVSDAGAGGEEFKDAPAATAPGYTDKIKATAAGTTMYGRQLASAAYEKVAAVAPSLRPQAKSAEGERKDEAVPVSSDVNTLERSEQPVTNTDATATAGNNNSTTAASGPGYTDKIKSAAVGTTEYGKQLASTVYEKVAGVSTVVASKVPGVGAQSQQDTTTASPGQQDKGVGITGYIAEKLRPSDEDRALSSSIADTVQRRKEEVGGTVGSVGQRVPAPGQVITKAREAVTSLTGGNRTSETVQPEAATGAEVKENVGADAPVLRGEEVGEPKLNTNTM